MIKIENNQITLTRGDTLIAAVEIYRDNEPYIPANDDVINFYLKRNAKKISGKAYKDVEPLITKTIPNETMLLRIDSADTKTLDFGSYVYDVEITFADGTIDTFINNAILKLVAEVD